MAISMEMWLSPWNLVGLSPHLAGLPLLHPASMAAPCLPSPARRSLQASTTLGTRAQITSVPLPSLLAPIRYRMTNSRIARWSRGLQQVAAGPKRRIVSPGVSRSQTLVRWMRLRPLHPRRYERLGFPPRKRRSVFTSVRRRKL